MLLIKASQHKPEEWKSKLYLKYCIIVLSPSTFLTLLTSSTLARITNVEHIFSVMNVQWTKEWNKLTIGEAMLHKWNMDCNWKIFYKQIWHNKELLRIANGNAIKGRSMRYRYLEFVSDKHNFFCISMQYFFRLMFLNTGASLVAQW